MNQIVRFIKAAGALSLSAEDIQPLLKKALGEDVPEQEIQKVLEGGQDGSQGAHQHHGKQPGGHEDPSAGMGAGAPPSGGAPDLSGISPMPGGDPTGGAGGPPGAGAPPIDPQELAALQQQFPQISPEDLAAISQAIEEYLAQTQGGAGAPPSPAGAGAPPPGAMGDGAGAPPMGGAGAPPGAEAQGAMPPMPPKQGSYTEPKGLSMVKDASYIYGFLESALVKGASLEQAINLYGEALQNTMEYVKQAEEVEKLASTIDDKTASWLEGIVEQANSRGYDFDQTVALLKRSGVYDDLLTQMTKEKAEVSK